MKIARKTVAENNSIWSQLAGYVRNEDKESFGSFSTNCV